MYNTILVPVDLSQKHSGISAIKIAKKLLDDSGNILLISVIEQAPRYVDAQLPKGIQDNVKRQALSELKNIAEDEGIGSNIQLRSGHAANEILEAAKSHNADLIIIASHRPGLSDYFLGSTAARVVRHAGCPGLVDR
ncbi:MAG: universal stress protein [bacterium]|nr:universal stress protein [bacterium]